MVEELLFHGIRTWLFMTFTLLMADVSGQAPAPCLCESSRGALLALHSATNGQSWLRSWDTAGGNPCVWHGVVCLGDTVAEISLPGNALSGTLPDALGELRGLLLVDLSNNFLRGTLPAALGAWSSIRNITMTGNSLDGTLSYLFSNWSKLEVVNLAGNTHLGGSLSADFSSWRSVRIVLLSFCSFSGSLSPSFAQWRNLTRFEMASNNISGILPSAFESWISLQSLVLDDNRMEGSIPSVYASWTEIVEFSVDFNPFLSGTLPPEFGSSWRHVRVFKASHCQLSGTLPESYKGLVSIYALYIGDNHFSGTIPSLWSLMAKISTFVVRRNSLSGTLPSSFKTWSPSEFAIDSNSLSGTLPEEYASWSALKIFNVGNNRFTGSLPQLYASWASIHTFNVEANEFTGSLPSEYGQWGSSIEKFVASNNSLTGTLPPQYANWSRVTFLACPQNQLVGGLPSAYSQLRQLDTLSLFKNRLNGTLPPAWALMASLSALYLYANELSGNLPDAYGSLAKISILFLGQNRFIGSLPESWGSAMQLHGTHPAIVLQNNSGLVGPVPTSWGSVFPAATIATNVFTVCHSGICGRIPSSVSSNLLFMYCLKTFDVDLSSLSSSDLFRVLEPVGFDGPSCVSTAPPPSPSPTPATNGSTAPPLSPMLSYVGALSAVSIMSPVAGVSISVFMGPSVALTVARARGMRNMAMVCAHEAASAGDGEPPPMSSDDGVVIESAVYVSLIAGGAVAMHLVAVITIVVRRHLANTRTGRQKHASTCNEVAAMTAAWSFPGCGAPLISLCAPTMMEYAIPLLVLAPSRSFVFLGVLSFLMGLLSIGTISLSVTKFFEPSVAWKASRIPEVRRCSSSLKRGDSVEVALYKLSAKYLLRDVLLTSANRMSAPSLVVRGCWVSRAAHGSRFHARFKAFFEDFGEQRHWYFALDAAVSCTLAILTGVAESSPSGSCHVLLPLCGAVLVVSCVMLVALRPYCVLLPVATSLVLSVFSATAGLMMLLSLCGECGDSADTAATVLEAQMWASLSLSLIEAANIFRLRWLRHGKKAPPTADVQQIQSLRRRGRGRAPAIRGGECVHSHVPRIDAQQRVMLEKLLNTICASRHVHDTRSQANLATQ